jgi:para-nitrobenzyl esterase
MLVFAEMLGNADEPASLEAMRAVPATEILAKFDEVPGAFVGPNVDGWVFPDEIHTIVEQGRQNRVPVIVGSNADEGSMYAGPNVPATIEDFRLVAHKRYGDYADAFLETYTVTDDSEVRDTFVAAVGDAIFTWEMRMWARMTATVDANAWLYHFTRVHPIAQSDTLGSHHGAEIVYVIGNFHRASFTPEPEDERLTETMSGYWVNFAATGDPNGAGLPEWPAYDAEEEAFMEFGDEIRAANHLGASRSGGKDLVGHQRSRHALEQQEPPPDRTDGQCLSRRSGARARLRTDGGDRRVRDRDLQRKDALPGIPGE